MWWAGWQSSQKICLPGTCECDLVCKKGLCIFYYAKQLQDEICTDSVWALNPLMHILIRNKKEENKETQRRKTDVKIDSEMEWWIYQPRMPRISRSHQNLGERHEEIFPQSLQKKPSLVTSWFWTSSELQENKFPLFKVIPDNLLWQIQNIDTEAKSFKGLTRKVTMGGRFQEGSHSSLSPDIHTLGSSAALECTLRSGI